MAGGAQRLLMALGIGVPLATLLGGGAVAHGAAAPGKKLYKGPKVKKRGPYGANSRIERAAEASGEATLRVRSIDLPKRSVVVEVTGFPKAPAGNLFTFVDDRGRRFIAVSAKCDDPFPSGTRVCDLETPAGYERHPWVGLALHLHGLASGSVQAPRAEVERAYEAARALLDEADGEDAETPEAPAVGLVPAPAPPPAAARPVEKEAEGD